MNNVFVYCEIDKTTIEEVSLELLTKGRKLANRLGVQLEAVAAGSGIKGKVEKEILSYGVDKLHVFDGEGLFPYTSKPHTDILVNLFKQEQPQICLMGATVIGRDLGPRVSSSLTSGLTADCTDLEIGDFEDKKNNKTYKDLLYQIRPAFGGNIVATIVNPDHRPQMATVRSGVMKAEIVDPNYKGEIVYEEVDKFVPAEDYVVKVIEREVQKAKNNLKGAPIVIRVLFRSRKASTCSAIWLTNFTAKSAPVAQPSTQVSANTTCKSDKPALRCVLKYTSLAVSPAPFSTWPV